MRITIEHERLEVSVTDLEAVTLSHALELISNALRGVGFFFDDESLNCQVGDHEVFGKSTFERD